MRKGMIAALAGLLVAGSVMYLSGVALAKKEKANADSAASGNFTKAAEFSLTDIDGKPVKLSDYKGKVVILDFWATWCPPCRKEIPHFNDLSKAYGDKGLVVLGVSVDEGGPAAVKKFKGGNEVGYRIAMVDEKTYGIYQNYLPEEERGGIPFTFVLDKDGNIREHYVGYREKAEFEKVVKALL